MNITNIISKITGFFLSLEDRLNTNVGKSKVNWGIILLCFIGFWCLGRLLATIVYFFG